MPRDKLPHNSEERKTPVSAFAASAPILKRMCEVAYYYGFDDIAADLHDLLIEAEFSE